jgi:hypothetical protein
MSLDNTAVKGYIKEINMSNGLDIKIKTTNPPAETPHPSGNPGNVTGNPHHASNPEPPPRPPPVEMAPTELVIEPKKEADAKNLFGGKGYGR